MENTIKLLFVANKEAEQSQFIRYTITNVNDQGKPVDDCISVEPVENCKSAQEKLRNEDFDVVVVDLNGSDTDRRDFLKWIKEEQPEMPVIMIGPENLSIGVDLMRLGARDYLPKPVTRLEIYRSIQRIVNSSRLQEEIENADQNEVLFRDLIGESLPMQKIRAKILLFARFTCAKDARTQPIVLISGESGTRRERAARIIHQLSDNASEQFITLNIGGVPESLLEAELFGCEKGNFPEVRSPKMGAFELLSSNRLEGRGTLFLDEIEEAPISLQKKVLSVFKKREVQRGKSQIIPVDVRILVGTGVDLKQQMEKDFFVKELYNYLKKKPALEIDIPLSQVQDMNDKQLEDVHFQDIPLFIDYFLQKLNETMKTAKHIEEDAKESLKMYCSFGNIRELKTIIERGFLHTKTDKITEENMIIPPLEIMKTMKPGTIEYRTMKIICEAFRAGNTNRNKLAKEFGVSRTTIITRINEYGLKQSSATDT